MAEKKLQTTIMLNGCTFERNGKFVTVKGTKGELKRKLSDNNIIIKNEGETLHLSFEKTGKKQKAQLFTTAAHIKNMIKGTLNGYNYKLKICSGHFPMNVSLKGDKFEIKNFIGEKVPRTLKIKPGATVKINGELIDVDGIDKEIVGQTAASIEKLTRRPGFDKRIFQDGIYITEKDGKKI